MPLDIKCKHRVGQGKIENVGSREYLTIHVVGARMAEVQDVTIWEIIPLMLPNLQHLTVVFIGPELQ